MIEHLLESGTSKAIRELYGASGDEKLIQIQKTRQEFEGDYTLVVFPLLRISKKGPEQTAEELGKYGVTVNVVCPGATQTGYITPENEEWHVKETPLGRLGYSEDIADVITFLVSEQARWLTGQLIYASGGFLRFMSE